MDSANQLQRKLQNAVEGMLSTVDRERLRPIQKATYLQMGMFYYENLAINVPNPECIP
jgi:hypothetical protein